MQGEGNRPKQRAQEQRAGTQLVGHICEGVERWGSVRRASSHRPRTTRRLGPDDPRLSLCQGWSRATPEAGGSSAGRGQGEPCITLRAHSCSHLVLPNGHWQRWRLGGTTVVWLPFILSEGDHRLDRVEPWVTAHQRTLRRCIGRKVTPRALTEDRLATILDSLGVAERWGAFARPSLSPCGALTTCKDAWYAATPRRQRPPGRLQGCANAGIARLIVPISRR